MEFTCSTNFDKEFMEINRQKKIDKNDKSLETNEKNLLKMPAEFQTSHTSDAKQTSRDWDGYSRRMLAVICCVMLFTRLSGRVDVSFF